ncbi:hypothetical protein D3C85_1301620 [compost metagenome]
MGVAELRQQPRQGGFADPGRAPEDHRVQRARFQCLAQRLAAGQQVLLANVLVQVGRAQARGQGLGYGVATKQVHGRRYYLLLGDDIRTFGDIELECARRDRAVGLDPGKQNIGALADAVDQLHIIDQALTER